MARKIYTGTNLDIAFDLDVCIHAAECVRGLPEVFNPDRKPWILPGDASADDLQDAVAACPSGALEALAKDAPAEAPAPAALTVQTSEGGPYIIKGGCQVIGPDGSVLREGATIALCACGRTASAPFCDGSHARA